jgi:hypothetical protein
MFKLIPILLLVIISVCTSGEDYITVFNDTTLGQFYFENILIDDKDQIIGLTGSSLSVIKPDFTREDIEFDKLGYNGNNFYNFCIDSSDYIWIISETLLIRFDKNLKFDTSVKAPSSKSKFRKIIASGENKAYLLSEKQLFYYDGDKWQLQTLTVNNDHILNDMALDTNSIPIVLDGYGIFTKIQGNWNYLEIVKPHDKPLNYSILRKVMRDIRGGYYFASAFSGLLLFRDSILKRIPLHICSGGRRIYDMCPDNKGNLFISSELGVSYYDGFVEKNVMNYRIFDPDLFIDRKNNIWINGHYEFFRIKNYGELPGNFIKTVKLNVLLYNSISDKYDKEIESPEVYELMPTVKNYDMMYPVGYFRNDTKDRYLNFKVRAYAYDKNKPLSYFEIDKNIDSVSLSGDPNITMLDSVGNSVPFNKEHGLPPGLTARVVFPPFKPSEINGALDGDIVMKLVSMNYDLDNKQTFPLEDVTDDTVSKKIALIGIADEIRFKNSFDTLIKEGNNPELIINPKVWVNTGGTVYMENRLSDFGTNHIKVNYNEDKSITLENVPYPLIKLNRFSDNYGNDYPGKSGGGSIVSPIINCVNRYSSYLNIEFSRNPLLDDNETRRGFSTNQLLGPERRVISPDNILNEINKPDKLIVEFISADQKNIAKLLNPTEEDWTTYQISSGDTVKGIPALSIFGGGGYCTAFDDAVRDSILNDTSGLRANIYDLGFDSHYQSVRVFIPDFMIRNKGYIRFRVRVAAKNDARDFSVRDDADDFFVKDLKLMIPCECGDVGLSEVIFDTPYSVFPKDHGSEIPLKVRVRNNVSWDMGSFFINLVIKNAQDSSFDTVNVNNGYNKHVQVPYVRPNQDVLVDFPPLKINREYFGDTKNVLKILARVIIPGGDRYPDNDSLLATYTFRRGESFAYDAYQPFSDVAQEIGIIGRGLNMFAYSSPDYNSNLAAGDIGGSGSGQIAIKFDLVDKDTIFGFCTYYDWINSAFDDVLFSIYSDENGLPGAIILGSQMYRPRCYDDSKENYYMGEYVKSLYQDPLILLKGTYWASITQLGETGFELGGSGYRMGMVTPVCDMGDGTKSKSIFINKYFTDESYDDVGKIKLENRGLFAYRNLNGKDEWVNFSPTNGNPAYAHLNKTGRIYRSLDSVDTYTRGTWVPMIRVFMDGQYYKPNDVRDEISADISIYPNPASDYIELNLGNVILSEAKDLRIYNSLGQCVLSPAGGGVCAADGGGNPISFGEGPGVRIDISALSPGLYFISINNGKKILTGSFIVLR